MFCQAITELAYKGIVVGDGDEKVKLEAKYPNIEFVGWKNKAEVKQYMKGARALIFPSRWYEGAPLTPLEAMQYGIPCIVSDVSAACEYAKEQDNIFSIEQENLPEVIKKYESKLDENYNKEIVKTFEKYIKTEYIQNLLIYYKEEII